MKTTKFNMLFIAIAIFMTSSIVISCGDDDEDEIPQISLQEIKSQLIGGWEELGYK